jgi:hypothetical protein
VLGRVLLLTRFPQISRRIRDYLNGDPGFSTKARKSYEDFMHGSTTLFVELLEGFFRRRPTRSVADTAESNVETAIQLLWFEEMQIVPQVHLVVDPTKQWRAGRNGFADMFVGNSKRQLNASNSVLVMELKNVKLLYLWKARQTNRNNEPTSQNDYEPLLSELRKATEDQLLDLEYTYFDKISRRLVTLKVRDTLQDATSQLGRYIDIISNGQGGPARRGVDDDRVLCRDRGKDVLQGHVVVCVGGTRVICRHMETKGTQYSYEAVRT